DSIGGSRTLVLQGRDSLGAAHPVSLAAERHSLRRMEARIWPTLEHLVCVSRSQFLGRASLHWSQFYAPKSYVVVHYAHQTMRQKTVRWRLWPSRSRTRNLTFYRHWLRRFWTSPSATRLASVS